MASDQPKEYRVLVLLSSFLPIVEAAHRHRPPNMEKDGCELCALRREARVILGEAGMAPERHQPGGPWKWAS